MANSLEKVESQRLISSPTSLTSLRPPMTTIAGFARASWMARSRRRRRGEALNVVVSETRRLSRLVRRMLDLSRLTP